MKTMIGYAERATEHEIIYIDYHNRIPHTVITRDHYGLSYWDAFANNNDRKDIRLYESGGGGNAAIELPKYNNNGKGCAVWVAEGTKTKGKTNATLLKKPMMKKMWNGKFSRNPFEYGEITDRYDYCEECGINSTDDFCRKHIYEDEQHNLRYKSDNRSYS